MIIKGEDGLRKTSEKRAANPISFYHGGGEQGTVETPGDSYLDGLDAVEKESGPEEKPPATAEELGDESKKIL